MKVLRTGLLAAVLGLAMIVLAIVLERNGVDHVNEPIHSAMEAAGGVLSIALAALLITRARLFNLEDSTDAWIAASLILSGALDLAHATIPTGPAFFWSRALPTLIGGVIAAGVWVDLDAPKVITNLPRLSLIAAIVIGVLLVFAPGLWPAAFDAQLHYSDWAKGLNVIGGIAYLAAAWRLVLRAAGLREGASRLTPGSEERSAFAALFVLLGIAGVLFALSHVWSPSWWLFHVVRFGAGVVCAATSTAMYRRMWHVQESHYANELNALMRELQGVQARRSPAATDGRSL